MRITKNWHYLILINLIIFSGCLNLTNFQPPETLEPGEKSYNFAGSLIITPEDNNPGNAGSMTLLTNLDFGGRFGIIRNLDVGGKIGISPPTLYTAIDIKYQALKYPFKVSIDVGVSYTTSTKQEKVYGFHPTVLVGKGIFHLGFRGNFYSAVVEDYVFNTEKSMYGLILGLAIGKKYKFIPEVVIYFRQGDPIIICGIGYMETSKKFLFF